MKKNHIWIIVGLVGLYVAAQLIADGSDKQLVDDVEMKIESLDEAYGELAELM